MADLAPPGLVVDTLMPAVVSPHHYVLRPSDAQRMKNAALFVWVGPELESALDKPVSQFVAQEKQIGLLSDLNLLLDAGAAAAFENAEEHDHTVDAHIWLSTITAKRIAETVASALASLDAADHRYTEHALLNLEAELDDLHSHYQTVFAQLSPWRFGAYHDAYHHLVDEFSLEQSAFVNRVPDEALSVKHTLALTQSLRGANCLIADAREDQAAAKAAHLLGIPFIAVDILGATELAATSRYKTRFVRYLDAILAAFLRCAQTKNVRDLEQN